MEFLNWVLEVNRILQNSGYDCLFSEEEIEEMKQGECTIRTYFQQDAELAFHKALSPQEFVHEYSL